MMYTAPRVQDVSADLVASPKARPCLRTLMFVGPHDVTPGAMAANEREFPCLSVKHAAVSPGGHRHSSDGPVASGNA